LQAAVEWYRKAAEGGDAMGENNLGDLYLRGEGVSQNAETAFELFSLAAEQGNTGACIKLGYLYMTGRGTRKDDESAYAWIKAAALGGDPRGAEYLGGLAAKLTSVQLKNATERASSLQARESAGTQLAGVGR
jgi:TPR repeat protein